MVNSFQKYLLAFALCVAADPICFPIDTSTRIFDREARSLSLRNPDSFIAPPVIRLGTEDHLLINFDIIGDSHEYLRYRLLHCNADWQPSQLLEPEYTGGFNEGEITDYAYSSNTYVHYVNYNLEIPNEDMKPLVSGNYLLVVYPEGNYDSVILQQRFYVSENAVAIDGKVSGRTDRGFNTEFQQLELAVDAAMTERINPYQDLVVTMTQNNRPETMRELRHPLRVEGGCVVYSHMPELVFRAGNEYRRFETVRTDYPGMNVDSVKFGENNWHAWLMQDESRVEKDYNFDITQHGRFKIDEYSADDPDLGADYVTVHFTLDIPEVIGADVYIDGDFALHQFNDFNKMRFDHDRGLYTAEIPLKQGSYNYQYVIASKNKSADPSPIEGDKYETGNEYLVCVYLRKPGSRADRLIGTALIQQ